MKNNLLDNSLCILPDFLTSVPEGYEVNGNGVFRTSDDAGEQITLKPIIATALSRDRNSNNWGTYLFWLDQDGKPHEVAFPQRLIHSQPKELLRELVDLGLPVMPSKSRLLMEYLALCSPSERVIAATRTGWINKSFVLPQQTLNQPADERIVFQPLDPVNHLSALHARGSHAEWASGITDVSPMIRFVICASLSAALRYKLGVESGGFHFYDETSKGKTTALQCGASCWGCGEDPQRSGGASSYITRWNSTINALEAKAELHNDLPMIVDEIGEADTSSFGEAVYRVVSGTGRERSGRGGGLQESKSWRTLILSAGELPVTEFLEMGGKASKGGQLVRLIDINLNVVTPLFASAASADSTKALCSKHYGHAGPRLIKRITDEHLSDWFSFDVELVGQAVTAIEVRARQRFALVLFAGYLASDLSVVPWSKGDILKSVQEAYLGWISQIYLVSDTDRGLIALRDFLLANESRFQKNGVSQAPRNRAGWERDDYFCFNEKSFKEAIGAADPVKVRMRLREEGFLHYNKGLKANLRINGQQLVVTCVKKTFMSFEMVVSSQSVFETVS